MKIFLDANVLVSVLNKEYPTFTYSARILSLNNYQNFEIWTSPLCLAIAYYFAEKKVGTKMARKKIELLTENLHFTTINSDTVKQVTANPKIYDVEDGLQYYSAIECGCTKIISEDRNDFYFSEIEVLTSRHFLEKYVL